MPEVSRRKRAHTGCPLRQHCRLIPPEVTERGPEPLRRRLAPLVHWLNEPMNSSQVSYRRRVINWLQAPAGH